MKNKKNFFILLGNLSVLSYLLVGLPKVFSILSPVFASTFSITMGEFDKYLYGATFYSLMGKIVFSFLINNKKFDNYISVYWLYIITVIIHGLSVVFCLNYSLDIHIIARNLQGLSAGIISILLEPIIFNCSESQWRNKLLYWKYELIALLTPISILMTSVTINYYQYTIMALAIMPCFMAISILFCNSSDNLYLKEQNNILSFKGFLMALQYPTIIINNIIIGALLAFFLILIQNHFYHHFGFIENKLIKGLIQGLPFTLSFLISKTNYRNFFKYIGLFIMNISIAGAIITTYFSNDYFNYFMIVFINCLYIIYVLWTPDLLTSVLENKELKDLKISHRSISTAAILVRSLSTWALVTYLGDLYKNKININFFYLFLFIGLFCFLSTVIFLVKKNNKNISNDQ